MTDEEKLAMYIETTCPDCNTKILVPTITGVPFTCKECKGTFIRK